MVKELVFESANLSELASYRRKQGYQFTVYDGGFAHCYGKDAQKFLSCGLEMIFSSVEMSEERLMLAKAQLGDRSVVLYVDRDYFEVILRDWHGHHHLAKWQFSCPWKGLDINDLEYYLARFLFQKDIHQKYRNISTAEIRQNQYRENWEESGEDPEIIRKMEDLFEDELV